MSDSQESVEKALVIHSTPSAVEIGLLEDGKLVELHKQKSNVNFSVGDILVGRVTKLMPGLNAAFVDIGHKKDAFLHYTDLGPQIRSLNKFCTQAIIGQQTASLNNFEYEPEIIKTGKIDQVLKNKQLMLVQILKEPISTKGPRLSCEITLPGRYMVLTPFSNSVSISKKIANPDERKRLVTLGESIRPQNFGIILRTAAEGKKVADLHEELVGLQKKWEQIHRNLRNATGPRMLLNELDKSESILRDLLNDSFSKILVDDKELYHTLREYIEKFSAGQKHIVQHYQGKVPIFDKFGITHQIKSSFGKTATMESGAYLVIEHTEAMHVVDVNSGPKSGARNQEESILAVNLESAKEIARQLRLRDIGGIIIIDFIDMKNPEHRKTLYQSMRDYMKNDRAQQTVLPLSKFGLMQITRQRVKPEVKIDTSEVCPTCKGEGKVNPTILTIDELQRDLQFVIKSLPKGKFRLAVHPYLHAYITKGLPNMQMRWFFKYGKWIPVIPNADFQVIEYKFYDQNMDEIRLQ